MNLVFCTTSRVINAALLMQVQDIPMAVSTVIDAVTLNEETALIAQPHVK